MISCFSEVLKVQLFFQNHNNCVNYHANIPVKFKPVERHFYMSRVVRKPALCICENKDADQLRGNREADQRLCFRYIDITIPLLSEYKISSLYPSSVGVQPGLCRTWSEIPRTAFLTTRLIYTMYIYSRKMDFTFLIFAQK